MYRRIPPICPPFLHAGIGENRGGAYAQDHDISVWRPLPTDDHHVGTRCRGCLIDKTGEKRRIKPWHVTGIVSLLTIAMVITGLNIQMARCHWQSRRWAYTWDKNTCAGTWAEMGAGLICMREAYGWDSTICVHPLWLDLRPHTTFCPHLAIILLLCLCTLEIPVSLICIGLARIFNWAYMAVYLAKKSSTTLELSHFALIYDKASGFLRVSFRCQQQKPWYQSHPALPFL